MAKYDPQDRFFHKAKAAGYRARSAYKLKEILALAPRHDLRGKTVLDLGAAPGGWLQVLAEAVGPQGSVIGVDLVAIAPLGDRYRQVRTHVADLRDPAALAALSLPDRLALVTSDMAPKTTGIHGTDVTRSLELLEVALEVGRSRLAPGGSFIAKVFMGAELEAVVRTRVRPLFRQLRQVRPEATRAGSREIYVVGSGFVPQPTGTVT
jgi:23S rRNA (uridine2552-2'-O)-methyltransferase